MLSVTGLTAQIGKIPVLRGVDLTVNDCDTVAAEQGNGVAVVHGQVDPPKHGNFSDLRGKPSDAQHD